MKRNTLFLGMTVAAAGLALGASAASANILVDVVGAEKDNKLDPDVGFAWWAGADNTWNFQDAPSGEYFWIMDFDLSAHAGMDAIGDGTLAVRHHWGFPDEDQPWDTTSDFAVYAINNDWDDETAHHGNTVEAGWIGPELDQIVNLEHPDVTGEWHEFTIPDAVMDDYLAGNLHGFAVTHVRGDRNKSFRNSANEGNEPTLSFTVVPEPGSLALLGLGGLMMLRRRRNMA